MKEVFTMWKHTKMVVLVALSAALYAALLIPFKAIPLIPGITEVRPASALPVVFGILFGPAGAWGSAIGNLIGDLGGTLGLGSLFGFVGNFMFAYVPYKVWQNIGLIKKDDEPKLNSGKKIGTFALAGFLGSAACALIIGFGLEFLKMVPFAALGAIITANNTIPAIVLGIPIMMALYPRVKKWDLLWTDIMPEEELPKGGALARTGAIIMCLAIVIGLFGGFISAMSLGQKLFSFEGSAGSTPVIIIAGLGALFTFIGSFMQN